MLAASVTTTSPEAEAAAAHPPLHADGSGGSGARLRVPAFAATHGGVVLVDVRRGRADHTLLHEWHAHVRTARSTGMGRADRR